MTRESAVYDTYCALRKFNYTGLGAIRALRMLGVTLLEAKNAHDAFTKAEAWEKDAKATKPAIPATDANYMRRLLDAAARTKGDDNV